MLSKAIAAEFELSGFLEVSSLMKLNTSSEANNPGKLQKNLWENSYIYQETFSDINHATVILLFEKDLSTYLLQSSSSLKISIMTYEQKQNW